MTPSLLYLGVNKEYIRLKKMFLSVVAAQHPLMHPPAQPSVQPASVAGHQEAVLSITTSAGPAGDAHTLMSYTDVTSSSTTGSSDGKKKREDDGELPQDKGKCICACSL